MNSEKNSQDLTSLASKSSGKVGDHGLAIRPSKDDIVWLDKARRYLASTVVADPVGDMKVIRI